MSRTNLTGYCDRCRLKHRCQVCHDLVPELQRGACPAFARVLDMMHEAHADDCDLRFLTDAAWAERERRVQHLAKRAAAGLPLFPRRHTRPAAQARRSA